MIRYTLISPSQWRWRWALVPIWFVASAFGFFNYIPLSNAITPQECLALYSHHVPATWQAVSVNHGAFTEFTGGLPKDHPIEVFGYGFLFYGFGTTFLLVIGRINWERREHAA